METKTLTIAHLAPYLPYGLKVKVGQQSVAEMTLSEYLSNKVSMKIVLTNNAYKPLLIPLSALNEIIKNIDTSYTPLQIMKSVFNYPTLRSFSYNFVYGDVEADFGATPQGIGYSVFQQLFEWHFDVFDLISQGLAINKLTIR